MRRRHSLLTMLGLLSVGCASPKMLSRPPAEPVFGLGHAALLDTRAKDRLPLDPGRRVIYSQSRGGAGFLLEVGAGGLGLVLGQSVWTGLLPPLVMGANHVLISRTTRREGAALAGHVAVDPAAAFRRALAREGLSLEAGASAKVLASPFLWLRKVDRKGDVALFVGLVLEPAAGEAWRCRYLCQVPLDLSLSRLAQAGPRDWEAWTPALEEGFGAILRFLGSPEEGSPRVRVPVSRALIPPTLPFRRDPVRLGEDAQRLWVLRPEGVFGVLRGSLEWGEPKTKPEKTAVE